MATTKVAITIENNTLVRLDKLVKDHLFPSRSKAIQEAVEEKLKHIEKSRLNRECSKLDPIFEQSMAEEGMSEELGEWPEY